MFSLAALSTEANAEEKYDFKEHLAFGGFVGIDFYSDDNELGNSQFADQVPGSGIVFGARGSYEFLTKPFYSLHGELEFKLAIAGTEDGGTRSSTTTPILGWRSHARMDYLPEAFLTPFAVLGLGGETLLSGSSEMDTPDTDPLIYAGVGAKVNLLDDLSVRADFRAGLMASRSENSTSLLEFFVGAEYRLGKRKKAAKPYVEDKPILDDSVIVEGDKATGGGETKGKNTTAGQAGLQTDKVDTDGDGIFSNVDQCPDQPEDKDAFEDEDGCPDPDNDKDGILDAADKCPLEAENINQVEDEDGCPDKDAAAELTGLYGVIEGVKFKPRKAVLVKSSEAELDKIYEILKNNPNLKIEIAAHTSKKGPKRKRTKLSSDRAETIKWYLVAKGANLDMLVAKGYGSDEPVDGKAVERVEIKKISTP